MADLISSNTQAIVVVGYQVPNNPIIFKDEPDRPLMEDPLMAKSWHLFMYEKPDDPVANIIFPMVKSSF